MCDESILMFVNTFNRAHCLVNNPYYCDKSNMKLLYMMGMHVEIGIDFSVIF